MKHRLKDNGRSYPECAGEVEIVREVIANKETASDDITVCGIGLDL